MPCAMRTGKGRVEVNSGLIDNLTNPQLEHLLRAEIIRILLKHPYMRQPENCSTQAVTMASDCVLTDNYPALTKAGLSTPELLGLPFGEAFEWYAHHINTNDDQDNKGLGAQSQLWDEDQLQEELINKLIEATNNWGTLDYKIKERIIASTQPKIDYRRAFAGFQASILSSRRHLTRMRPNRRMEFEQMGSVYQLSTRLLIAVDVSASVKSASLSYFYGLINRFFQYGIEQMDVVQFDNILGEVQPFKQHQTYVEVIGRGGTDFQPIIDYAASQKYDGLCILTDGEASVPKIPSSFRCPLLWVLENEKEYRTHHEWMLQLPHSRVCWLNF